jgi:hypothetical protein
MKILSINKLENLRIFAIYCTEHDTLLRSVKTALVVGTLLALINHGQDLLSEQFSLHWVIPMLLTYLVPFSVAMYSQVQGKRQRDKLRSAFATQGEYIHEL